MGRLARHFRVVWIEPAMNWRHYWLPGAGAGPAPVQTIPPDAFGLERYDPGRWLPELYRPEPLARWIRARRVVNARRRLEAHGCRKTVLYLWRPDFDFAVDAIDADLVCYHIDDEYTFSKDDVPNDPREEALIRRADQVIIHSRRLLAKKGHLNPETIHVPNGVEFATFSQPAPEPADIARIPRPRMGYVGVVKSQLDIALIDTLAARHPEWSFVLVGPEGHLGDKAAALARLRARPNAYLLGNRPLAELPACMQALDVCMMCYEVCDYTHFIHPLKLNEYLATGRPVVSSPIDAVLPLDHLINVADGADAWSQALGRALGQDDPAARQARQQEAARHDWDALAARIADRIRDRLGRTPRESVAARETPSRPA